MAFFLASSLLGCHSGKEKAGEEEEPYDRLLEKMKDKAMIREGKTGENHW